VERLYGPRWLRDDDGDDDDDAFLSSNVRKHLGRVRAPEPAGEAYNTSRPLSWIIGPTSEGKRRGFCFQGDGSGGGKGGGDGNELIQQAKIYFIIMLCHKVT